MSAASCLTLPRSLSPSVGSRGKKGKADARQLFCKVTLTGHTGAVYRSRFSPDSALLASCSFDTTVRVWDWAQRREAVTLRGHRLLVADLCWATDGAFVRGAIARLPAMYHQCEAAHLISSPRISLNRHSWRPARSTARSRFGRLHTVTSSLLERYLPAEQQQQQRLLLLLLLPYRLMPCQQANATELFGARPNLPCS